MSVTMPEYVDRSHPEFLALASPVLEDWSRRLARFPNLSGGRWHPTGFMVFNLEDIEGLGQLRLHVWPRGERISRPNHPSVHSHCFHLLSAVIKGVYCEKIFDVAPTEDENGLFGFTVEPPVGDGIDRLAPDGVRYSSSCADGEQQYSAGASHNMAAGDYHATYIPRNDMVATLALLSRPVPGARDHIIGDTSFELSGTRAHVTPDQMRAVCDLLW